MNSADHDKWELNRMLIGGAVKMGDADSKIMNASLRDGIEIEEDRVIKNAEKLYEVSFDEGKRLLACAT